MPGEFGAGAASAAFCARYWRSKALRSTPARESGQRCARGNRLGFAEKNRLPLILRSLDLNSPGKLRDIASRGFLVFLVFLGANLPFLPPHPHSTASF